MALHDGTCGSQFVNGSVQQEGAFLYLFTNSLKSRVRVRSANIVKTDPPIGSILLVRSMPLLGFGCYKVGVMEPRFGHGHGGPCGPGGHGGHGGP